MGSASRAAKRWPMDGAVYTPFTGSGQNKTVFAVKIQETIKVLKYTSSPLKADTASSLAIAMTV